MKSIKTKSSLLILLLVGLQFLTIDLSAQTENESQVVFLRPQRGMGQGIQHVLSLNGKEVGRLTNGSMLTYTLKEEGNYELLIKMLLLGAPSGTPFSQKITVSKGNPVYVDLRVTYAKIAEIIDTKKAPKLMKKCSYKTEEKE